MKVLRSALSKIQSDIGSLNTKLLQLEAKHVKDKKALVEEIDALKGCIAAMLPAIQKMAKMVEDLEGKATKGK